MLKDLIAKYFEQDSKSIADKITNSLMDGYVDIKAYKDTENGKELVYHDTGDNVVTNWMRQAIMMMLAGYSISKNGRTPQYTDSSNKDFGSTEDKCTQPIVNEGCHSEELSLNADGYLLNGEQYFWDSKKLNSHPVKADDIFEESPTSYKYPYFPTKVLFGTGKEYISWDDLQYENQSTNASWYVKILEQYGGEKSAADNFQAIREKSSNFYSGTVGVGGNTTGDAGIVKAVTVNDPNNSADTTSTSDMASRYGVVGAVKTLLLPNKSGSDKHGKDYENSILDTSISDDGKLIRSDLRGVGRPCFIYFNRTPGEAVGIKEDWSDPNGAQIFLSKDATNSKFLNRITFRITMPSQSAGSGYVGAYYPYNGYTLKQLGLFNDVLFATNVSGKADSTTITDNMPSGMLLAIKNIEPFEKKADESIVMTWTLTI